MDRPDELEDLLLEHRAPADLMHRALVRLDADEARPRRRGWLAAAALLLGAAGGWSAHGLMPAPVVEAPPSVVVASAERPISVKLVIHAPEAEQVTVAGSFNDWDPEAMPLQRAEDGSWHATVRLVPGRYEYLFVLDGSRWVGDPTAPLTAPDDFGQANAILEV